MERRLLTLSLALILAVGAVTGTQAEPLGLKTPQLSAPLQQEKFFDMERLTAKGGSKDLETQLGLSYAAREVAGNEAAGQATHRLFGEAGGKVELLKNVSLSAVARLPLYVYEARSGEASLSQGKITIDAVRKPGSNLSWRSELGVNLGLGVDLNLFYDRSMLGSMDRPGMEERDEKFGTRFIIRFK